MSEGTITISSDVNEQQLMEGLLNHYYSGEFVQHFLILHALANRWHIDKFTYYFNMINGEKK